MATTSKEQVKLKEQLLSIEAGLLDLGKKRTVEENNALTEIQAQIKALNKLVTASSKLTMESESQVDLAKILEKSMKNQVGFQEGLKSTRHAINMYGEKDSAWAKKLTKALGVVVDNAASIQQNMEAIGSAEFQTLNLSKQIFQMRKMIGDSTDKNLLGQLKFLELQQNLQDRLQKAHDITEETATQFMKPAKYMQELIGKLPIVGGMLSKLLPVEEWEDTIKNKIGESLKGVFGLKDIDTPKEAGEGAAKTWNEFQSRMKTTSTAAGKLWKKQKKGAKVQEDIADESEDIAKSMTKVNMKAIGFVAIGAVIVGLLAKWVMASVKFANETGLAYTQTVQMGAALAINAEGVSALTSEFGNINDITSMHAGQMLRLNKQYGISATTSAKILKLQTATSGQTKSQLLTVQKEVAQMARLEGVSPAAVFESMAADSEAFAKFTKDSGKNLMKMAIQAKKVGLEMGSILSAMEGSLDLESSINAQFEASVLLGRQINLDKFRQLSLAGDALGAQKEIVRLVGSESEWNSMNLIQRKALAAAVGLQVAEVSKVVGAQNSVNKATEEGSSSLWKWVAIGAALGTVLLGIVGALVGSLNSIPILGQKMSASGWKGMKSGALKGGGTGLLLGGIGGGVASAMMAKPPVSGATMNPGTVANVRRGEMSIHKGETAVNTQDFSITPMVEELKAMRKDMRVGSVERAEQSRQQVMAVKGMGAANA